MEVTPPVARYEQVARHLRERIFGGEFPPESKLPSGPEVGRGYGVSQHMAQRAFEILAREGLVRMTSGSGTSALPRLLWLVELGARLPAGADEEMAKAAGVVKSALELAAAGQPAVREAVSERIGDGVRVRLAVESVDLLGALAALTPVARHAFGTLPVAVMSARAARDAA